MRLFRRCGPAVLAAVAAVCLTACSPPAQSPAPEEPPPLETVTPSETPPPEPGVTDIILEEDPPEPPPEDGPGPEEDQHICDKEPPVISGRIHKTIFIGDTIAYRLGVTATDSLGGEIELRVDSSAVNRRKEGEYTVIYSAEDSCGNETSVRGSVIVHSVTPEQVEEMADGILEEIITEDMTQYDVALTIYYWVQDWITYGGSTVKDSVTYAAYRGFKDGHGDCYIYYAVTEILLTRAGIDNIPIERIPGQAAMHYWSLVDIGGGWRHFDATPHENGGSGFLFTESEARILSLTRSSTYYTYDKTLYPEVEP